MATRTHPDSTRLLPRLAAAVLLLAGPAGVAACAGNGSGSASTTVAAASTTTSLPAASPTATTTPTTVPSSTFTLTPDTAVGPLVVDTVLGTITFTAMTGAPALIWGLAATSHGPVGLSAELEKLLWSTDGGMTWQSTALASAALDLTTDGDNLVVGVRSSDSGEAARYTWDGSAWQPAGRLDTPVGASQVAFGPHGAVAVSDTRVYFSRDGVHFVRATGEPSRAALGATGSGGCSGYDGWAQGYVGPVIATDSGFVMLTSSHPGDWGNRLVCEPVLWTSTDGDRWQLVSTESPFGAGSYVEAGRRTLAIRDGRFVLMGGIGTGDSSSWWSGEGALWWSGDGLTWHRADVDLAPLGVIAAGELGWMVLGSTAPGAERGATWYSADGRTWDGPHPAPAALGLGGGYLPAQIAVGHDSIFGVWATQVVGRVRP